MLGDDRANEPKNYSVIANAAATGDALQLRTHVDALILRQEPLTRV